MGKFTKTVFTGATTAAIAREIANQAGIFNRLSSNWDELAMRRSVARPHKVLITITVDRVEPRRPHVPTMAQVGEHALLLLRAAAAGHALVHVDRGECTIMVNGKTYALMLVGDPPWILSDKCVTALREELGLQPRQAIV